LGLQIARFLAGSGPRALHKGGLLPGQGAPLVVNAGLPGEGPPPSLIRPLAPFSNKVAAIGQIGALLLEQNDEWVVQRARYMTPETIAPMSDDLAVIRPPLQT
jgi:hypothetical protein